MIKVMSGNGSSSNRPAEVQLGSRPVELSPASKDDLQGGAYSQSDPWPISGAILETGGSHTGCDLPVGEGERLTSVVGILDALKGALVVGKMVKDPSVPKRSRRARGF